MATDHEGEATRQDKTMERMAQERASPGATTSGGPNPGTSRQPPAPGQPEAPGQEDDAARRGDVAAKR